jgi:hypothetical protein
MRENRGGYDDFDYDYDYDYDYDNDNDRDSSVRWTLNHH